MPNKANQAPDTVDDELLDSSEWDLLGEDISDTETQYAEDCRKLEQLKAEREHRLDEMEAQYIEDCQKLEQLKAQRQTWEDIKEANEQNPDRLVAISADWTHDKKEMSHDLAERALNKELEEAKGLKGIATRIWKGNFFKGYFTEKYAKEYMQGKRVDEQGRTILDIVRDQKQPVLERYMKSVAEGEEAYIHDKAGEKLVAVDEQTNSEIKEVIEEYIYRRVELGEDISDITDDFDANLKRVMQSAVDDGRVSKGFKQTNLQAVAEEGVKRYEKLLSEAAKKGQHELGIEEVMAGFQVYDVDVRNGARTEAHRNNVDKIVDKLSKSKLGNVVSNELLYIAAGTAMALTQTGARAAGGVVGGLAASTVLSGLKERNRMTEDRVRMLRDIAEGKDYEGNGEDPKEQKGRRKTEAMIGGTIYDIQKASDLTARLEEAMDPENEASYNDRLYAIAEARVRIDLSDSANKDLISYSSADKRGEERLALDAMVIKAEKSLSKEDKKLLQLLQRSIEKNIIEDINEKDEDFSKKRAYAAIKKAGITLGLGIGTYFASQEIAALIDPNKIGIFEKAGLIKRDNNLDAKETVLAGIGGRGQYTVHQTTPSIHENVSDPKMIEAYEKAGYTKVRSGYEWSEPKVEQRLVDPSASTARVHVKYDGWANNGTKFSDGNELRAHLQNGQIVSAMRGSSTMNGQTINYDPGKIKAYLTIGNSKFEIKPSTNASGQLTWGDGGVFTTTTGEQIQAIGPNGEKLYRFFEIAADNGNKDGVQHIIPLATDVGKNTFSGKILQTVEETVHHPETFTFTKRLVTGSETFTRGIDARGLVFTTPRSHTGIGAARAAEAAPTPEAESAPETEPTDIESTAPTPETGSNTEAGSNTETTQNPEQTNTPETEYDRWKNQITEEIDSSAGIIGGEVGPLILKDNTPFSMEKADYYEGWWDSLSEEGRNRIKSIIRKIDQSKYRDTIDWGNSFRLWLFMSGNE